MEEKNSSFFKTYYILMITFGVIGLIDAFITYFNNTFEDIFIWSLIAGLFSLIIFILSIIAIIKFLKYKFNKLTLVIPIYHLVIQILLFIFGIIWGIMSVVAGIPPETQTISIWFSIVATISSVFEIIFVGYILNKFK